MRSTKPATSSGPSSTKTAFSSGPIVAIVAIMCAVWMFHASSLRGDPRLRMTKDERAHALASFEATAPANKNVTDTVWARRVYAPMYIHSQALKAYREQIERAFPEHAITFDVCFAAGAAGVPWHTDYDSLGPFASSIGSIAREDFITVHTNLVAPEGGQLRTMDSLMVAATHYVANRVMRSFGSLGEFTSPLAAVLGMKAHDTTLGVGNAFNNLKAHEVTAGRGRVSYVVRLVRKDVKLLGDQISEAANGGTRSTRSIPEFERFLPLLNGESTMAVGEFPWGRVGEA